MPRTRAAPPSSPLSPGIQPLSEFMELGRMNLQEKQAFVHVAAKNSSCRETLVTWKRKDLLELLSLEMGKEMKFTGVPKSIMVDHLMLLISSKEEGTEDINTAVLEQPSLFSPQNLVRRQRKRGFPSHLPPGNQLSTHIGDVNHEVISLCTNSACKAQLSPGASFCKRCSCLICHQFDDNKDPSLWIVCSPDALDGESGCNLSCHIECALGQELAGVVKDEENTLLDGSYHCESCGSVGDLIGCWRKQLLIAKDARRVDVLCYRLSLSYRLFSGTVRYKELHDTVVKAVKKLESEVGSITEGSAKFVRGIVNRLSSASDIRKLIRLALEKAESLFVDRHSKTALSNLQGHTEARCFTKNEELIQKSTVPQLPVVKAVTDKRDRISEQMNMENDVPYVSNDFSTNFMVRDLGKVLHSAWHQDQQNMGVLENVFGSAGNPEILEREKQVEFVKLDEHVCPVINALLSPGADTSTIEDGQCKSRQDGADTLSIDGDSIKLRQPGGLHGLDLTEELDTGSEKGTTYKALLRKDSSELEEIRCIQHPGKHFVGVSNVTEANNMGNPNYSQSSRGEQIDVSPVASGSVQANAVSSAMIRTSDLGANGFGEGWAVQVRMEHKSIEMKPQTHIIRKRTIGGLEESHNCYSLLNGCTGTGCSDSVCAAKSYEYCVKIIRWLECEGHLKEDFRKKFLTWFSLRATDHEKRVVSVFIDTLQDNPTNLSEQLVDTFGDVVSAKRQVVPHGFCNRLWH